MRGIHPSLRLANEEVRQHPMLRYDYELFRIALGQRVKQLRKERKITHRALVNEHGFHLTQVSRIERGEAFSVPTLLKLAETFQVPVGQLIDGIGEVSDVEAAASGEPSKKTRSQS